MSVGSIINSATGKIYDDLVPQGGGVALAKGGLITADGTGTEQALAVGNDGWVLSADSNEVLGLKYIQLPAGGINFSQEGQLLYAGAGPAFQDSLLNIGSAGQILGINAGVPAWINAGGSGTITALAPLTEYADGTASKVAVNFTGKGELIVGGGAQVGGQPVAGGLLSLGTQGQILAVNTGNALGLEWIEAPVGAGYIPYFQELPSLAQNASITPSGAAPEVDITTGIFLDIPVSSISGNPSLNPLTFVDFYIQFEITTASVLGGASKLFLNPVFQVASAAGQPYGADLQFNIPVFTVIPLVQNGFLSPPATQIGTVFCRGEIEITSLNPTDVIKIKVNAVCDIGSLDLNGATGLINISCNVSKSA